MEYDVQKEARVWQRVQEGKQTPSRQEEPLPALIREQQMLSSVYMQMARQRTGQSSTVLMGLARQARSQAACLRGIVLLSGGNHPQPSPVPMQSVAPEQLLNRCYGQELRLLREYENRCGDAQFGPAYTVMARRTREICCTLLELIGMAKTK